VDIVRGKSVYGSSLQPEEQEEEEEEEEEEGGREGRC
jgi:hypothetical protein